MRLRLVSLLLPIALITFLATRASSSSPFFHHVRTIIPINPTLDPASFQEAALETANKVRANSASPAPALTTHSVAVAALEELVRSGIQSRAPFDRVFNTLQERRPQIQEMGSNLITASSQGELFSTLATWPELKKSNYTHLATTVFRQPGRHDAACLAVVLNELQPLELPAPRRVAATGYDICPLCNSGHAVTLSPQSQSSLVLRCPHCGNPYNLLAADSSGNWRRASQFLETFDKIKAQPGLEPEDVVLDVWRQVDDRCRYQLDPERVGGEDSWNLPRETYAMSWGDCEDTAMLLTAALLTNGIEARVALGRMKGRGHAWCVVRLNDRQYILESTAEGVGKLRRLPYMDDMALDYNPECLLDRETICFNLHHQWTANYWSGSAWLEVKCPQEAGSSALSANP